MIKDQRNVFLEKWIAESGKRHDKHSGISGIKYFCNPVSENCLTNTSSVVATRTSLG